MERVLSLAGVIGPFLLFAFGAVLFGASLVSSLLR